MVFLKQEKEAAERRAAKAEAEKYILWREERERNPSPPNNCVRITDAIANSGVSERLCERRFENLFAIQPPHQQQRIVAVEQWLPDDWMFHVDEEEKKSRDQETQTEAEECVCVCVCVCCVAMVKCCMLSVCNVHSRRRGSRNPIFRS